ncbi:MAG: DUF1566 domain-containing protein [Prevotellaceae bacterium]|nr:DUF1566 domain-containing protein [Prevotellaceae bacterium]
MRNNLFRVLALAAIATASFTLFSCSSDDDDDNKPEENITTGNDDKADENVSEEENDNTNDTSTEEEISSQTGTHNGHEYVDLGISVKWATCNVGASSPSEFGDYFAWGETSTKATFTIDNSVTYGKSFGDISGNPSYDAARAKWGGSWRMPTADEIEELAGKCKWTWGIIIDGRKGCKVTGPNGNSLFIPAAGYCSGANLSADGEDGYYWSSTSNYDQNYARVITFYKNGVSTNGGCPLYDGLSVRAVIDDDVEDTSSDEEKQNDETTDDSSDENNTLTGIYNGHDYVDLGLSVKWATCNVGASSASDYGNYYAWGETSTKSSYTSSNCATYGVSMGDISGDENYDTARANWGGTWRMPTSSEMAELEKNCTTVWTTMDGVKGYKVTGPNGNSIFLPAAGYRNGTTLKYAGSYGFYWTSSPGGKNTEYAWKYAITLFSNSSDFYNGYWFGRYDGVPVRPVSE